MAYCINCGSNEPDENKYCSYCGQKLPESTGTETAESTYEYSYGSYEDTRNTSYESNQQSTFNNLEEIFDPAMVKKGMGILSYLGILVLIPLLAADRSSEYIKFHVNQGLVLFGASFAVDIIENVLRRMSLGFLTLGTNVVSLAIFVLAVMGIISACTGSKKPLPIVGDIQLLK